MKSEIRAWAAEAAARVASGSDPFVTNHLDEILVDYSPSRGIETAHKAFAAITEALADIANSDVVGRLVIPLGWSADVVAAPPTPSDVQARWRQEEPPSLYLCRADTTLFEPWREEYRLPMPQSLHQPPTGRVLCWYCCGRSLEDRATDQEWSADLWFDYLR